MESLVPSVQSALDKRGSVIPASTAGTVFRQFCYRYGIVGNLVLSGGLFLPPLLLFLGFYAGGVLGALIGTVFGTGLFWSLLNHVAVYGNQFLQDRLTEKLRIADSTAEFVGLCQPENNSIEAKLFTLRLETDDNVGFLALEEEQLIIRMEEGNLAIPRDLVRDVSSERFVELPYLRWIAIEYFDRQSHSVQKLLLYSRQAHTLQEARQATDRLRGRLIDWYTEPILRQLETERWGAETDEPAPLTPPPVHSEARPAEPPIASASGSATAGNPSGS